MIRLATTLAVAVIAVAGCAGDAETATPATSEAPPAAVQASPTEITIAAAPEPSEAQKKAFFTALASVDPALATNPGAGPHGRLPGLREDPLLTRRPHAVLHVRRRTTLGGGTDRGRLRRRGRGVVQPRIERSRNGGPPSSGPPKPRSFGADVATCQDPTSDGPRNRAVAADPVTVTLGNGPEPFLRRPGPPSPSGRVPDRRVDVATPAGARWRTSVTPCLPGSRPRACRPRRAAPGQVGVLVAVSGLDVELVELGGGDRPDRDAEGALAGGQFHIGGAVGLGQFLGGGEQVDGDRQGVHRASETASGDVGLGHPAWCVSVAFDRFADDLLPCRDVRRAAFGHGGEDRVEFLDRLGGPGRSAS